LFELANNPEEALQAAIRVAELFPLEGLVIGATQAQQYFGLSSNTPNQAGLMVLLHLPHLRFKKVLKSVNERLKMPIFILIARYRLQITTLIVIWQLWRD
jgi:hypothetical protein